MIRPTFTGKSHSREIHPLDPQPNRHSMLVPRVCAPRVTRWSLGRYWSRDLCSKQAAERLTGWLGIQTVILSRSDRLPRERNLMTHAQCPLPVYSSQVTGSSISLVSWGQSQWLIVEETERAAEKHRLTPLNNLKQGTDLALCAVVWHRVIALQSTTPLYLGGSPGMLVVHKREYFQWRHQYSQRTKAAWQFW